VCGLYGYVVHIGGPGGSRGPRRAYRWAAAAGAREDPSPCAKAREAREPAVVTVI